LERCPCARAAHRFPSGWCSGYRVGITGSGCERMQYEQTVRMPCVAQSDVRGQEVDAEQEVRCEDDAG
jgi:Fe-S cluster assembly iron-binding protein IscA